jgi:hypothetical protein
VPPDPEPVALDELWYWYSQLEGAQREGYIELYDALMAWLTGGDVSTESWFNYEMTTPGFTMDDYEIIRFVAEDNPLIFSVTGGLGADETDGIVSFFCGSSFSQDEMILMAQEMETEADRILSGLTSDMSDYEKYYYIANALCQEVSYDYVAYGWMNSQESLDFDDYNRKIWANQAYGALVSKLAVCGGYSFAYQYLCNRAGLWCISPSGDTPFNAHQWNMIRLDDGYYWVDLTWMDDGHGDRYFCLTDEQLALDHTPDYPPVLPACDATKYAYMSGDTSNL